MALSLPQRTTELVTHGNAVLTNFQAQGRSIHDLAFQEKAVAVRIQHLIDSFDPSQVINKAAETIVVLKEAQNSFNNIKDNIVRIDAKEKELSSIIQQIFERQQQGDAESRNIQAEVTKALQIIQANDQQIAQTKANLDKMQDELGQLERAIHDAEQKAKKKKKRKKLMKWIAIVSVIGAISLPFINKPYKEAKRELEQRREMFHNTQNHFNNLQATQQGNYANKARLENEQAQRQHELNVIADILNRLRPAHQDSMQYRQYLLALSDALNQVNSFVQRLDRNLNQTSAVQAEGITPDGPMKNILLESHRGLSESWIAAKGRPAVQVTLNLGDPNSVDATLNAIKGANLNGKK